MKKLILFLLFGIAVLSNSYAQNYTNLVNYYINGTPTNGVKIKTNLPFTNGSQMPIININGYAYGSANVINLSLVYYIYSNSFINYSISSHGNYTPQIYLSNENSKVVIYINDKCYYERFTVSAYANGMQEGSHPEWFQGWVAVDEALTGTNTVEVNYSNKVKNLVISNDNSRLKLETISGASNYYTLFESNYNASNSFNIINGGSNIFGVKDLGSQYPDTYVSGYQGIAFLTKATNDITANKVKMYINQSGNVGIGTTTPGTKLSVAGEPGVVGTFMSTNGSYNESATIMFQNGRSLIGYDGTTTGLKLSTSDASKPIVFTNSFLYSQSAELMRINGDGNVGIGTQTPTAKFYVESGANKDASVLATSDEGNKLVVMSQTTQPADVSTFKLVHDFSGNRNNGYISFHRGVSTYGGFLDFGTNGLERLRINANGNVGIGTTNPQFTIDVNGSYSLNRPNNLIDNYNTIGGMLILTPNPYSAINNGYLKIGYPDNQTIRFGTGYDGHLGSAIWKNIQFGRYTNPYVTIMDGGNVGIGTTNPQNTLDVKGTIRATEVKVESVDKFADFVFDKQYKLPTLNEVQNYINKNGRLPEIPSAQEVKENGMNLTEMNVKLLQKVEELTLYILEQQKQIDELKKKMK